MFEPHNLEWAIVDIAGRRRLAGCIREEFRFGVRLLRIDCPVVSLAGERTWRTFWFQGKAIHGIERSDAEAVAALNLPDACRLAAPGAIDPDKAEAVAQMAEDMGLGAAGDA